MRAGREGGVAMTLQPELQTTPEEQWTHCTHEDIRLYCGVGGEQFYNHHPVYTGPYACVSPVFGSTKKQVNRVRIPPGVQVFQDSGAFTDACLLLRETDQRKGM